MNTFNSPKFAVKSPPYSFRSRALIYLASGLSQPLELAGGIPENWALLQRIFAESEKVRSKIIGGQLVYTPNITIDSTRIFILRIGCVVENEEEAGTDPTCSSGKVPRVEGPSLHWSAVTVLDSNVACHVKLSSTVTGWWTYRSARSDQSHLAFGALPTFLGT